MSDLHVEILTVGDEVVRAETAEDNSRYIAARLTSLGLEPARLTSLPDDIKTIALEIAAALERGGTVIVTGGLGPTVDDVTREAAIEALGGEVEVKEEIIDSIRERFGELGLEMPPGYLDLSRVPAGAEVLPNSIGAANGLRTGDLYLLPGVPAEMRAMFEEYVVPAVAGEAGESRTVIKVFGMMETAAEDIVRGVVGEERIGEFSILAGPGGIRLYVPPGEDIGELKARFGNSFVGEGSVTMEEVVLEKLREKGMTLSTAESLTGGMLASRLIGVSGASVSFLEGFITYSNEAKVRTLGVDPGLIEEHGAVSREVCVEMAAGAMRRSGSDLALSTTGIAGPTGATPDKVVGLCYIGLAAPDGIFCREMQFPGDRHMVRTRTVYRALDMLRLYLMEAG